MPKLFLLLAAAALVWPCRAEMPPSFNTPISHTPDWSAEYRRPTDIPFPDDNPYTAAKAELGKTLFFDPMLSGDGTHSCSTCHQPGLSWGDGLAHAVGTTIMLLRSPTLLNVAWSEIAGWDGKFETIESVAFAAILNHRNMNQTEARLLGQLREIPGYVAAFHRVFPDGQVTRRNMELALATFERTIVSARAPFDRWIEGDPTAISAEAQHGFEVFRGKGHCAACHIGWNFTEGAFYDVGLAAGEEVGRGRLFPQSVALRYAFKVPTLRDVARRAPYMHNGSLTSLEAVVEFYDSGGLNRPSRSPLIQPLGLGPEEKRDLIDFLRTLSEDPVPFAVPVLPS